MASSLSKAYKLSGRWVPLLTGLVVCLVSCRRAEQSAVPGGAAAPQLSAVEAAELDRKITNFCSGCHVMPQPSSFPADAWYDEVKRGFDFYHQSGRHDLNPPAVQRAVDYFRSRAPMKLEIPLAVSIPGPDRVRFRTSEVSRPQPGAGAKPVAVSFIDSWKHTRGDGCDLIFSDMANGQVIRSQMDGKEFRSDVLLDLTNPAVATRCDLNGNGRDDLVVAELGSFNPADHDRGRVIWLADVQDNSPQKPGETLIEGLGRVADVQPADIDGDGDTDLIVAEFGWHKTGRILYLCNEGSTESPDFTIQVVDRRPGTIHVPIVDLNRDGRADFIALISQEFEVIEFFLNQGNGTFERQRIHSAPDPAFGSSGIQVVDLDDDGDEDILYTNGDMFDSMLIKPYHGIQWLENTGNFPFVPHRLTDFPGAYRALAGDLDRDGDLDIVASAFVAEEARDTPTAAKLESLIWLEQVRPGEFVRHALESANCIHAALTLSDIDGDGDLDIAAGSFRGGKSSTQSAVTIWWNETRAP